VFYLSLRLSPRSDSRREYDNTFFFQRLLMSSSALVLIIGLGILATYTGYVIGQFHQRYPHIQNLADAGEVLFGAFGRELFGIGQLLFSIFIMGSHILTFSVMMNTITEHGTCTMVFTAVGFVICMVCSLPRTMKNMTYISCACTFSFLPI
jgi:hypothetical protein